MNYVTNFLAMQNQFRVMHWQTQKKIGSFAAHNAFGTAYEELDPLIDDFIEIFQGKNGVIKGANGSNGFTIQLSNLDDNPEAVVDECIRFLIDVLPQGLSETEDTDLLNIRDEILAILNQTKYRLDLR
jgi:DNA-binding ferritin-like protein